MSNPRLPTGDPRLDRRVSLDDVGEWFVVVDPELPDENAVAEAVARARDAGVPLVADADATVTLHTLGRLYVNDRNTWHVKVVALQTELPQQSPWVDIAEDYSRVSRAQRAREAEARRPGAEPDVEIEVVRPEPDPRPWPPEPEPEPETESEPEPAEALG